MEVSFEIRVARHLPEQELNPSANDMEGIPKLVSNVLYYIFYRRAFPFAPFLDHLILSSKSTRQDYP